MTDILFYLALLILGFCLGRIRIGTTQNITQNYTSERPKSNFRKRLDEQMAKAKQEQEKLYCFDCQIEKRVKEDEWGNLYCVDCGLKH